MRRFTSFWFVSLGLSVSSYVVASLALASSPEDDPPSLELAADAHEGAATYFGGLGVPAGGCGLPQYLVDSQNFLALNVTNAQAPYAGEFDQGRNCGRWVEVTLSQFCKRRDHTEQWNMGNCEGGVWEEGPLSGRKAYFVVADSCPDGNYWCRNDRFHVDLSTMGLGQFGLDTSSWRNPKVSWRYVPAPAYQGDVGIGFARGASSGWPAILLTHLERGIHRVEQWVGGRWVDQSRYMTLGQVFVLTNAGSEPYRLRLYDADDQPVQQGRVYVFQLPKDCCARPFNPVAYGVE